MLNEQSITTFNANPLEDGPSQSPLSSPQGSPRQSHAGSESSLAILAALSGATPLAPVTLGPDGQQYAIAQQTTRTLAVPRHAPYAAVEPFYGNELRALKLQTEQMERNAEAYMIQLQEQRDYAIAHAEAELQTQRTNFQRAIVIHREQSTECLQCRTAR